MIECASGGKAVIWETGDVPSSPDMLCMEDDQDYAAES
jgi:hypothetical protein